MSSVVLLFTNANIGYIGAPTLFKGKYCVPGTFFSVKFRFSGKCAANYLLINRYGQSTID